MKAVIKTSHNTKPRKKIAASVQNYRTDPQHLMTEEDMLNEIIGSILNLVTDCNMSVNAAAESYISWVRDLVETAKAEIESGNAKSEYEASTNIHASSYCIRDTYGIPQAGVETIYFDTFDEAQDYILENPDVEERMQNGYARLCEVEECTQITSSNNHLNKDDYYYYGKEEYEKYGELVSDRCKGMIISKRKTEANEPGGLLYEANMLNLDSPYSLLKCLEGMCNNGEAVEISDYQYKVL